MQTLWFRSLLSVSLLTALILVPLSLGADEQEARPRFGDGIQALIRTQENGISLGGVGSTGSSLGTIRKELPPEESPSPPVALQQPPRPPLAPIGSLTQPLIINLDGPEVENYLMKGHNVAQAEGQPVIINLPVQDNNGFPIFGGGIRNNNNNHLPSVAGQTNIGGHGGSHASHNCGHTGSGAGHQTTSQGGRKR